MSPVFSDDFKELVRSRTDLVALIGESVSLRPRHGGREYVGLCPFHEDHNPSLTVSPERQSYKCWSCGEGGDCYSFVMQIERLTFPESLEMLAKRVGIEMPKLARRASGPSDESRNLLHDMLDWAEREFHACLKTSPAAADARDYLTERGFATETIDKFRLGCHPGGWDWLLNRARGQFTPEQLFRVRLVRSRDGGAGYYDDFRERVLFPIRDVRGRTVAFGGRVLPLRAKPDSPKYLNSQESELFSKSRLLFGFDAAREAIRKSGVAVVVEGYADCIMAHQHGIAHVVGTLGTSLTEAHVLALKRFARTVVMLYDGDEAGQRAAEKSLVKFLAQDVDLRILTLPDDLDPDEFLAAHGAAALQSLIASAPEAWDHRLTSAIARNGTDGIDARQRTLDEMLDLLVQAPRIAGTPREDIILAALAQRLRLDERHVRRFLTEARRRAVPQSARPAAESFRTQRPTEPETSPEPTPQPLRNHRHDLIESELIEIIFAEPELADGIRESVSAEEFEHPDLRRLVQLCFDVAEEGTLPTFERVMSSLESPDLKRLAATLDSAARDKKIAERLREDGPRQGSARPKFLDQALAVMHRRRRERTHLQTTGPTAERAARSVALDQDAIDLLRRTTEYRLGPRQPTPR